jgi:hypothetical protein
VTAELKPPKTAVVNMAVLVFPRLNDNEVALDVRLRPGTESARVAVLVTLPPVALTVKL